MSRPLKLAPLQTSLRHVRRSAHNTDFCRLRISKNPANAPKTNYFSTLGIERGKGVGEGDVLDNWGVLEKGEKWYNGRRICSQVRGDENYERGLDL